MLCMSKALLDLPKSFVRPLLSSLWLDRGEKPNLWYHGCLTRHAAEALLLSNGRDGSYLLRDSHERRGLYSLSVRAKDSVKHFHVEYTGYSFKFGFNEFSSLKDFIKHFANQPLIGSETGTLIVLKHPYPREVEEPSIYESVRVHTAMQTGKTEDDLVPTAPSVLGKRVIYSVVTFECMIRELEEIIPSHFKSICINTSTPLKICSGDSGSPEVWSLASWMASLESMWPTTGLNPLVRMKTCQLGTKEGYLTKQGGLVKTWKTRWFTLHRNELKYFKDQMSPEPIRILDLTECSAVQFDYSQERVNCFWNGLALEQDGMYPDAVIPAGFRKKLRIFFKNSVRSRDYRGRTGHRAGSQKVAALLRCCHLLRTSK
ncbi:Dual adapter for phosphotyrosine and 3-phosphotyrosine and 3-phosphoinositide [Tupaia chinensis]|uniref:Dual adapter for phosphotyrosine and 3-phosphotyrosine and 3-phosphoinositide n=1 Tax=Tupaia chinensis TaxID=246437 RepID=L9KK70_TUPCH|nr:Dual adapter for phosphotyrosine and 3-phosphotyrosine and 3-phosphoinositide [Tupaia chinensis]